MDKNLEKELKLRPLNDEDWIEYMNREFQEDSEEPDWLGCTERGERKDIKRGKEEDLKITPKDNLDFVKQDPEKSWNGDVPRNPENKGKNDNLAKIKFTFSDGKKYEFVNPDKETFDVLFPAILKNLSRN